MIVTRQRRKPFPWRRVLILAAIAAIVAGAFAWPVSRALIAQSPPGQAVARSPMAAPFNAMALQRQTAAQAAQIQALQAQNASLQSALDRGNRRIAALQHRLHAHTARRTAPELGAAAHPSAAPAPAASTAPVDLASTATPQDRRTAADWSAMDASAAAKIAQRLPMPEVERIFAVMQPDAVGPILEALPPAYAAKLTQEPSPASP